MKAAILQSNYIPWKGYFDIIGMVDEFVFLDDVQYTKQDWRNRNKIKTPKGSEWLTVPCGTDLDRLIHDVEITNSRWQKKHWAAIQHNYSKCPGMKIYRDFLVEFYEQREWTNLSEMNQWFITRLCRDFLGMKTQFRDSREFSVSKARGDRVLGILVELGATAYLSGPAANDYLDPQNFDTRGIELQWMDYSGYPEYRQKYPPFEHGVSIIDLLLNEGDNAPDFMKFSGNIGT